MEFYLFINNSRDHIAYSNKLLDEVGNIAEIVIETRSLDDNLLSRLYNCIKTMFELGLTGSSNFAKVV